MERSTARNADYNQLSRPILSKTVLEIRAWHNHGSLHFEVQWDEAEFERFRNEAGEEVAAKQLRTNAMFISESVEDVLARRTHPAGLCLPGCPYHGGAAVPDSV